VLDVVQETLGRILYKLPSIPGQAQIEVTNVCNLDCKMCPREKLDVTYEHIPVDRMKAIVDRLTGVRVLTLTGWGEPFLHPQIFEMIQYSKQKGFEVHITTNGVFKASSVPRILGSGLDSLSFSIDTPTNGLEWGHSSKTAVERMKQVIQSRKGKRPSVTIQATLHKGGEGQIEEVIRLCAEAKGDRVNLGRLDTRYAPAMERPDPEEETKMLKKADQLGRKLGVQVDSIQYAVSTGIKKYGYRIFKRTLHRMGRYCLRTYDYIYINNAGDVTPCCLLPSHTIGNILESDLATIWGSRRFGDFRENQKKICGKCDLWQIECSD